MLQTENYKSLKHLFQALVPQDYRYKNYSFLAVSYIFDRGLAHTVSHGIAKKAPGNRIATYIIPEEIERVGKKLKTNKNASIRFGNKKSGRGLRDSGERADFCLLAGSIDGSTLTLFYRSLDLIAGIHYDQAIILFLEDALNLRFKKVRIFAARGQAIARSNGNNNEKVFKKLRRLYE